MIDPMKKLTIACLTSERQTAIEVLRRLGTVHVVPLETPVSEELDVLKRQKEQLSRTLSALRNIKVESKPESCDAEQVLIQALQAQEDIRKADDDLAQIRKSIATLAPWGSFSRESIASLEARGIYVALCMASSSQMPELPDGAAIKILATDHGTNYFAVISSRPLDSVALPKASLPQETNLDVWNEQAAAAENRKEKANAILVDLAAKSLPSLQNYENTLDDRIAFATARDGMAKSKAISFLKGYVPADHLEPVREAARSNGWAIRYEEIPDDDPDVPTNLKIPRGFEMAKNIFDFVGILPGYHEVDVSISMLVFLSIFCGILVGDAGYGLLFTLAVLWFRRKTSGNARNGMNLLLVMSLAILIFGGLSGNWFAIPAKSMPFPLSGLPWLSNEKTNQQHVQLLAFFLGAFHMSLARVWNAILAARKIDLKNDDTQSFLKKIREILGHIAWGLFLWANFGMTKLLIVQGGGVADLETCYRWLYLIGFIMILAFSIDWRDMGGVIYSPFGFINSFVDVLSYIRLFAVGLSSLYIAQSFNGMAQGLCSLSPWLIPAALLVLALGHILNIALAVMGVLVHGIRLNTLEFSGHMGLSWTGKAYKPLTRLQDKD